MTRKTLWTLLALGGLVLVLVGVLGAPLFLPEKAQFVDEAMPPDPDLMVLKRGVFDGAGDGVHHVSGNVSLVHVGGGYRLLFEDYHQTQGPDVFVYLTAKADARSTGDVESGLRVLIDGGADGGESTKVGTFAQRLPDDFEPEAYQGVALWCDQWNVYFGGAALTAV